MAQPYGVQATPSRIENLRKRLETSKPDDVMVIAHRACWHEGPENSLPAIEGCIRMGVDMVEIDIQVTADGKLIIMHDESVDRTTNGSGLIKNMTLAKLKTLYLKEGQGGEKAPLTLNRIPTLEEALKTVHGRVLVNLDAKGDTLLPTLAVVRKLGYTSDALFKGSELSSHDLKLFEGVYFMPIVRPGGETIAAQMARYEWFHPVAFEIVYKDPAYQQKVVTYLAGKGYRFWVNIMWEGLAGKLTDAAALKDPDANWGYLVSQGINMIQTDEPKALLEYLQTRKLRQE